MLIMSNNYEAQILKIFKYEIDMNFILTMTKLPRRRTTYQKLSTFLEKKFEKRDK